MMMITCGQQKLAKKCWRPSSLTILQGKQMILLCYQRLFFLLCVLFMQEPNTSKTRKPWYQRAVEMSTIWKILFRSPTTAKSTLWKTIESTEVSSSNHGKQKLRKSTSQRIATSFTSVCLCAPISSYNEVFNVDVPPRRSYSYPRSSSFTSPQRAITREMRSQSARHSTEGRRIFRGKSLTDNVLMRRFVVEEEAMVQVRRRNQMEIVRKRAAIRRKKLGPSPLCRMVIAEDEQDC
ncbi:uncharacterized protein LOC141618847 [Silene latifolia]|uniref:uncharacterized protein LOC141618847 n=1 Tax=Silene latifolia TaxID=37657 RepID=UPI003D779946